MERITTDPTPVSETALNHKAKELVHRIRNVELEYEFFSTNNLRLYRLLSLLLASGDEPPTFTPEELQHLITYLPFLEDLIDSLKELPE